MRREAARLDRDAAGRLLEGASDRTPREMTVRMATSDRTRLTGRPDPLSFLRSHFHSFFEEPPLPPNATPRRFASWFLAALAATMAGTACTIGGPPAAPPTPVPTPADSASKATITTARWTPVRSPGSWSYLVHSTGTVSLSGDTTADSLPIARTIVYSITLAPALDTGADGTIFRFSGSVDSVAVTIPDRIPVPTAGSNSKPHFQGTLAADGHLLTIASNATSLCAGTVDPLTAASTLLFAVLPEGISPGSRWADTASTTTCRGRLPLLVTATRHYEAIDDTLWGGRRALLITRTDSLAIHSTPKNDSLTSDSTDSMRAHGSGMGAFTLLLDPSSGTLLQASGMSRTEILVTMGTTRFPFQEEAHQTITLLDSPPDRGP